MGNSHVGDFDRFGRYKRSDERDGFVHSNCRRYPHQSRSAERNGPRRYATGDEGISGSANTAALK